MSGPGAAQVGCPVASAPSPQKAAPPCAVGTAVDVTDLLFQVSLLTGVGL